MPLEVGQRLGDYEVQQMLGVGGMGHVYRVRNIISNRTEAMKVLLPDLSAEPDLATRFISEIRTLASFDHPNIAQLHTALIAENQLIMMMEYVEGYTLEQLAKQRQMPVGEVAGYVSQALSALGYAHERDVVHRDVKPANLMVTSHGIVKLMDFGIAKSKVENNNHTRPGTTMGSLYYMSPEQVRGDTVDARSDIYSVGIVLYELLAGRRPFESDTTFTILNKQLNETPQPPIELNPAIPAGLNAIILIALAKDPGERFQNAEAFRNALKSFCGAPAAQDTLAVAAVAAPVAAAAASSAPASATAFATPSASFATPPPVASSVPPAYAETPRAQPGPTLVPAKATRSNKPLWIATGAVAAILALVAVGIGVPHWKKTHAAANSADNAAPADTTVSTTPPVVAPTPTPSTGDVANSSGGTGTPSSAAAQPAPAPMAMPMPAAAQTGPAPAPAPSRVDGERMRDRPMAEGRRQEPAQIARQEPMQGPQRMQGPQQQAPQRMQESQGGGGGGRGLEEAQERMVDIDARATSARRQVGQIRKQQEADGLGLRGDVESAESRLDSYLRAARNDVQRGDGAAAQQDLNKAEPELKTLERFLGH